MGWLLTTRRTRYISMLIRFVFITGHSDSVCRDFCSSRTRSLASLASCPSLRQRSLAYVSDAIYGEFSGELLYSLVSINMLRLLTSCNMVWLKLN